MEDLSSQLKSWLRCTNLERKERQLLCCWKRSKIECTKSQWLLQAIMNCKLFIWLETFTYQKILQALQRNKKMRYTKDSQKAIIKWKRSLSFSNSLKGSLATEWCLNFSILMIHKLHYSNKTFFNKSTWCQSLWLDFSSAWYSLFQEISWFSHCQLT